MAGDIAKGLEKARALANSHASIVVYKLGPDGSVTLADGEEIRTGIFPVQAVKPTGAGDSFMAGFMASLAEGRLVAKPGCAPAMPHMPELAAFLATHPGATSV